MVTSLSLPPFNYFILNFFTFTIFFLFLIKKIDQTNNKKIYFIYGWLFGFGYFVTNLYWISISLTFDQNYKFLIPFSIILIPTFLGLFYGLISYLFILFKPKNIISSFLLFSLIFGILEFIRGTILTGFPWNLVAFSFSNQLEILSINSVIGTYGFNLFCISLFVSPSIFIFRRKKKDLVVCVFFFITFLFFYFYGINYNEKFNKAEKENYDYKIRIIGSNISLDRFYYNIDTVTVIEDLIKISEPNKSEKTIFIWPEGILPGISQKELIEYSWLFNKNFNENHLLIIGTNSQSVKNESKNYYNSFSVFDNKLNLLNSYNKINLVPFGEFLPFENILKLIGLRTLTNNYQSFSRGIQRNFIEIKKKIFI
jgi:apolipoprotein N-acyltransferase